MTLIIQYRLCFWKKPIDLSQINLEKYHFLNGLQKAARIKIAASMIKKSSDKEILDVIEKLSGFCFDLQETHFIRKGSSNFLSDVIKAYIDFYDGERFANTFQHQGFEGIKQFKCSAQSTAVLSLLWHLATEKVKLTQDEDYLNFLPANICNKVWQVILLERAPPGSVDSLARQMQQLAANKELTTTILTSNVTPHRPHAPPQSSWV